MEVGVRVEAESPLTGERRHTSTAYLTMVAVDEEGTPTPVPSLTAESEAERRRQREAELRRRNRLAERDQILRDRGRNSQPRAGPRRRSAPDRSSSRLPTANTPIHITVAAVVLRKAIGIESKKTAPPESSPARPSGARTPGPRATPDRSVCVHDLRLEGQADTGQIYRVEDDRGPLPTVVAEHREVKGIRTRKAR